MGTVPLAPARVGAAHRAVPVPPAAKTPSSAPTFVRVHAPDHYGNIPTVYGDVVIWNGSISNPHWQPQRNSAVLYSVLYAASLTTGRIRQIAHTPPPLLSYNLMLSSARWLSWLEYNSDTGVWRLMATDRHGGAPFVVDSSALEGGPSLAPQLFPYSSLDGDTLAWSYSASTGHGPGTTGVRVTTLPHGPVRLLARTTFPQCSLDLPSISRQRVAWDELGGCVGPRGRSDIILADLRTGRQTRLTHDHRSSEPALSGDLLAYKGNSPRFAEGVILLRDLRTGRERVVDGGGYAGTPHLTDRLVVWQTTIPSAFLAQDLRTLRRYVLVQESPDGARQLVLTGALGQAWHDEVPFSEGFGTEGTVHSAEIVVAHVP